MSDNADDTKETSHDTGNKINWIICHIIWRRVRHRK